MTSLARLEIEREEETSTLFRNQFLNSKFNALCYRGLNKGLNVKTARTTS